MEKQYSVQFFTTLIESLQNISRNKLNFNQFVEVSGYISVEIDNVKKERYVLSEMLQTSGNAVSESYCTKVFKSSQPVNIQRGVSLSGDRTSYQSRNARRNQENVYPNESRRRSWTESPQSDNSRIQPKFRRHSEVIEIDDEPQLSQRMHHHDHRQSSSKQSLPGQRPVQRSSIDQGVQSFPKPRSQTIQRTAHNPVQSNQRTTSNSIPKNQNKSPELSSQIPQSQVQAVHVTNQQSSGSPVNLFSLNMLKELQQADESGVSQARSVQTSSDERVNTAQVSFQNNPSLQNVSHPSNASELPNIKSELQISSSCSLSDQSTLLEPWTREVYQSHLGKATASEEESKSKEYMNVKMEPKETPTPSHVFDDNEIIDLDLFDDDMMMMDEESDSGMSSSSGQHGQRDDQLALARDYGHSGTSPHPFSATSPHPFSASSPQHFSPNSPHNFTATSLQRKEGRNIGTARVIAYAVNQFKKFHLEKSGLNVDIFALSPSELDKLLLEFYKGATKRNGEKLNARTVKNVQVHLDMHFREQGYKHSLARDELFRTSRDYVKAKLDTHMASQPQNRMVPVDDRDIEKLFQRGVFGSHSPESMFNTLWFMNSRYLAIKKSGDHFKLKWGDFIFKTDDNGLEYIERWINNSYTLQIFAKPHEPLQCFVNVFKTYWNLRPAESLHEQSPFYLNHCKGPNYPNPELWYSTEAIGLTRFVNVWKRIQLLGGLGPDKKIM